MVEKIDFQIFRKSEHFQIFRKKSISEHLDIFSIFEKISKNRQFFFRPFFLRIFFRSKIFDENISDYKKIKTYS